MTLQLLKFKQVQLSGSIFWLSLLIIHVIGLNFISHEAKDYVPEGAGLLNLSMNTLQE